MDTNNNNTENSYGQGRYGSGYGQGNYGSGYNQGGSYGAGNSGYSTGSSSYGNTGSSNYGTGSNSYSTGSYNTGSYNTGSYNTGSNSTGTGSTGGNGYYTQKKKSGFGKVVVYALVFGLISGGVFTGITQATNFFAERNKAVAASNTTVTSVDIPQTNGTTADTSNAKITAVDVSSIVDAVMPSVVSITNASVTEYRDWFGRRGQQQSTSLGSGFIVHQSDTELLIATNYHVVDGASKLTVGFCDGEGVEAVVKATDPDNDMAVVAVNLANMKESTLEAIRISKLGDSTKLKVGETAIVVGNALGTGQSVTTGVISALERTMDNDYGNPYRVLQTDAAINLGNSGGALLNANGEVVGISNAKAVANYAESMCYAIPLENALPVIQEAINGAPVATESEAPNDTEGSSEGVKLGIAGINIGSAEKIKYNVPMGAYISSVEQDGAAAMAGLEPEDIIFRIDDKEITTMQEIQEICKSHKKGDTITVEFYRADNGDYSKESTKVTF